MNFLQIIKKAVLDEPQQTRPPVVFIPAKPKRTQYIATALQQGWQMYGTARGTFVQLSQRPTYAFDAPQRVVGVCAVAAIYIALSGARGEEVQRIGYDAAVFGITRLTGINYGKMLAPAVQGTEHVKVGEDVSFLGHLMTLTDYGWPEREIIAYAFEAEKRHRIGA